MDILAHQHSANHLGTENNGDNRESFEDLVQQFLLLTVPCFHLMGELLKRKVDHLLCLLQSLVLHLKPLRQKLDLKGNFEELHNVALIEIFKMLEEFNLVVYFLEGINSVFFGCEGAIHDFQSFSTGPFFNIAQNVFDFC